MKIRIALLVLLAYAGNSLPVFAAGFEKDRQDSGLRFGGSVNKALEASQAVELGINILPGPTIKASELSAPAKKTKTQAPPALKSEDQAGASDKAGKPLKTGAAGLGGAVAGAIGGGLIGGAIAGISLDAGGAVMFGLAVAGGAAVGAVVVGIGAAVVVGTMLSK